MNIVTNTGSNLPAALVARYNLHITGNQIVADGALVDTRKLNSSAEVDAIVAAAKAHPHVLGTSSSEFVKLFRELAATDREILVVTTSRKASGTHDAAIAASRTLQTMPLYRDVQVSIVDTAQADLGTGLVTLFCAASAKQKRERRTISEAARQLAMSSRMYLVPTSFDYLTKSGRASFMKTMAATLLGKLPIIATTDGELRSIGTMSKNGDIPQTLLQTIAKDYPLRRKVIVGVMHAQNERGADDLEALLREHYDVQYLIKREIAPIVYMNIGPGVAAAVVPADNLPWPVDLGAG